MVTRFMSLVGLSGKRRLQSSSPFNHCRTILTVEQTVKSQDASILEFTDYTLESYIQIDAYYYQHYARQTIANHSIEISGIAKQINK